jgi:hypothetical protein
MTDGNKMNLDDEALTLNSQYEQISTRSIHS